MMLPPARCDETAAQWGARQLAKPKRAAYRRTAFPLAIVVTPLVEVTPMTPGIGNPIANPQRDFRPIQV
jgi:hypothetical protein